jgi:hypothetical protein
MAIVRVYPDTALQGGTIPGTGPLITVSGANQTITTSYQRHHITGGLTDSVQNISAPDGSTLITLIPDDVITFFAGGNIAVTVTTIVDQLLSFEFDGSLWYPNSLVPPA